ncbi:MAG: NAD(P)H-binding protein [Polyangia bacterium]
MRRLLVTGATGFVGKAVIPEARKAGWTVRAMSRKPRESTPLLEWVQGDMADAASLARAMDGCDSALYLVHSMGSGDDFARTEREAAQRFRDAAEQVGLRRVVYLGGIEPAGAPSEHLRSRLEVGEILRSGQVEAVELRASMIVGEGSLSWLIVRDLAARLPFMLLPSWLRSKTEPVAIEDVVVALTSALELPLAPDRHAWFDLPGPEELSGRQILEQVADALGLRRPRVVEVPLITPRLSSFWVRLVTRAKWSVAKQIVLGLTSDVLAKSDRYWALIGHPRPLALAEAAKRTVAAERAHGPVPGPWGAVERRLRRPHHAT